MDEFKIQEKGGKFRVMKKIEIGPTPDRHIEYNESIHTKRRFLHTTKTITRTPSFSHSKTRTVVAWEHWFEWELRYGEWRVLDVSAENRMRFVVGTPIEAVADYFDTREDAENTIRYYYGRRAKILGPEWSDA